MYCQNTFWYLDLNYFPLECIYAYSRCWITSQTNPVFSLSDPWYPFEVTKVLKDGLRIFGHLSWIMIASTYTLLLSLYVVGNTAGTLKLQMLSEVSNIREQTSLLWLIQKIPLALRAVRIPPICLTGLDQPHLGPPPTALPIAQGCHLTSVLVHQSLHELYQRRACPQPQPGHGPHWSLALGLTCQTHLDPPSLPWTCPRITGLCPTLGTGYCHWTWAVDWFPSSTLDLPHHHDLAR